ncbi:tyrosine-type recombinase/integrase [Huintestinicola sp.]
MSKRAKGEGTIRKRADGIWEARFYVGRDPCTGRTIRKLIYGKTQADVRKKLTSFICQVDEGTYLDPAKMSVEQWLDTWIAEYTRNLKPYSLRNYKSQIKNHIKPFIGAVKVANLTVDMIQRMYNRLLDDCKLCAKTLRNIHGILHAAYETLVDIGGVKSNPCTVCIKRLPKVERKELQTLADDDLSRFIEAIKGHPYENLFLVDLFTVYGRASFWV